MLDRTLNTVYKFGVPIWLDLEKVQRCATKTYPACHMITKVGLTLSLL